MPNDDLFRQAADLLKKKDAGGKLTEEELQLINTAIIPMMVKTDGIFPKDITIGEGLEELAKIVEGGITSEPRAQRNPALSSESWGVRDAAPVSLGLPGSAE